MRQILAAVLLVALAAGCKNRHVLTTAGSLGKDANKALKFVRSASFQFESLEIKGNGDYEDGKQKLGFAYRFRIIHGSVIWATGTKFGFEGMRMLATKDSVFILNRLEKSVLIMDYDCLSGMMGMAVDYQTLENILVGNFPLPDSQITAYEDTPQGSAFKFRSILAEGGIFVGKANGRLAKIMAKLLNDDRQSTLGFGEYAKVGEKTLPFLLHLYVTGGSELKVVLKHKKADWNPEGLRTSFQVPDDYQKIQPC